VVMGKEQGRSGTAHAIDRAVIFRRIDPPATHPALPINCHATWYTWSEPFRTFLRDAAAELRRLARPPLVSVPGLVRYDTTFSRSPTELSDTRLQPRLRSFARSLHAIKPPRRLILFDGLIGRDLGAGELRALFALVRGALVEFAGDPRAAMYSPLGDTGRREGAFPLHADLYIPQLLFNVFDQVPTNDSGASLFLPVSALRELTAAVPCLPPAVRGRILRLFEHESGRDRFDVLYDLLHGRSHAWVPELERCMEKRQLRLKLHSGQGYLLHDRAWLHGREAPKGGVPSNRVQRLVFGCVPRRTPRSYGQGRKMPV
jgi:hypothetical protein